jgi:hypothetical protein
LLTIKNGGLQYSSDYVINVTVKNRLFPNQTKTARSFRFSTGSGPKNGFVSITPFEGGALNTVFNFTVYNWESDKLPIKYRITG